jgi:hypothetical protein
MIMNTRQHSVTHAPSLRTDILAASAVWLPRREAVFTWLDAFLLRAAEPVYALAETEADDLVALKGFLCSQAIPAA